MSDYNVRMHCRQWTTDKKTHNQYFIKATILKLKRVIYSYIHREGREKWKVKSRQEKMNLYSRNLITKDPLNWIFDSKPFCVCHSDYLRVINFKIKIKDICIFSFKFWTSRMKTKKKEEVIKYLYLLETLQGMILYVGPKTLSCNLFSLSVIRLWVPY